VTPAEIRVCILIPTYDNVRTIADVVERAQRTGLAVLVVDDGSRDGTAAVLDRTQGITVRRQPENRGKGAALASGFELAGERGFTHALTLDSDGQHPPEEVPKLLAALAAHPTALIIGARDLAAAGAGRGSRFGCRFSNFWTTVETGVSLPDTQSGMRVYPLQAVRALALERRDFAFEIEVLVKASWSGVPLVSVPIQVFYPPPEERVSHFRPLRDFARIGWLNTRLCFLRLALPQPFLALQSQRAFHALSLKERLARGAQSLLLEGHGSSLNVAGSVALGLFMGIAPVWGFQVVLTLTLAHLLGASKTIAVVAAHVSFPLMVPLILYASLVLGRTLLGDSSVAGLALERADFWRWIVGSFALAALVAAAGFAVTWLVLAGTRRSRRDWKPGW
jgi:uncharacterized protein (DUF2062 family)